MTELTPTAKGPAPARTQRDRGTERRDEILSVAIDHIARLGFEGLRVREVAKAVGINNATLLHHYPTKESLVAGVIERFVEEFEAAQPARLPVDVDRRLDQYMVRTRKLMRAQPAMFIVLNELLVRAARDAEVSALMAPSQERWLAWLCYLLDGSELSGPQKRQEAERCRYELLGESMALGAQGKMRLKG